MTMNDDTTPTIEEAHLDALLRYLHAKRRDLVIRQHDAGELTEGEARELAYLRTEIDRWEKVREDQRLRPLDEILRKVKP